jgi:TonB family protein
LVSYAALALLCSLAAPAQQQAPAGTSLQPAGGPSAVPAPDAAPAPTQFASVEPSQGGGITEDEVKQLLVGKSLYIRGGYLDNSLSFDEHGRLIGHSLQGSYALSLVEINKVRLTKRKVDLEGIRYGLHFLGALPYEDPTKAADKVRITPKKKMLKISIDRELVVKPKKKKKAMQASLDRLAKAAAAQGQADNTDQIKAAVAAATEAEAADPRSVTTTFSPAHATRLLKLALDRVFAQGLDARMIASMPDFWKLYYRAVAARTDYLPSDSGVLRQNAVDQPAKLLSTFEPPSNEFAQSTGVAGMALYHAVIGPDGKPGEIVVARPIGFGLDENAVDAIRKASFEPAVKDGKPVPVVLDLVVQFRIYSKRTAVAAKDLPKETPAGPLLPGPYTLAAEPMSGSGSAK